MELLCKDTSTITSTERSFSLEKEIKKSQHYFLPAFKWSLCLAKNLLKTSSVDPWELTGWKVKLISRPDMLIVYSRNKKNPSNSCSCACLLLKLLVFVAQEIIRHFSWSILSENFRLLNLIFSPLLLLAAVLVIHASFSFFCEQCSWHGFILFTGFAMSFPNSHSLLCQSNDISVSE